MGGRNKQFLPLIISNARNGIGIVTQYGIRKIHFVKGLFTINADVIFVVVSLCKGCDLLNQDCEAFLTTCTFAFTVGDTDVARSITIWCPLAGIVRVI